MTNLVQKFLQYSEMQAKVTALMPEDKSLDYPFKLMPFFNTALMSKDQAKEIESAADRNKYKFYAVCTLLSASVDKEAQKGGILLKAEDINEQGELIELTISIPAFSTYDGERKENSLVRRIHEGSFNDKGEETERAISKGEKFVLMYHGLKAKEGKKAQFYHDFAIIRNK